MPEGDTIFRTARTLGRAFTGKTITRFQSAYAQLTQADDQAPFSGETVLEIESRGKWLLIHFSGGRILATHMLMSGSWHIYRPGERWQQPRANMRILIETADFIAVGFRIPVAHIHTAESLARDTKISNPQRDVLSPNFLQDEATSRLLTQPNAELADALLNQSVLAGVGNVFKSEICFLASLSPFRPVGTLSPAQAEEVVAIARKLLAANVLEDSGDQIVTFQGRHRRTTHNADPKASLWVYGRKNEPCRRCGEPIQRCLQGTGARSTYWCPRCQPNPLPE
jgi:endonuclease-8